MNPSLKIGQPHFLTKDEALTLHRASLDNYGGTDGLLNEGALESALAMPEQGFGGQFAHEFPFTMAAAYGFHLSMNHAFRDGNKRTAFACMVAFLRMNGWNFFMPDDAAAALMLELIEQKRDKAWLAERLAASSKQRPSIELRDFFQAVTGEKFHDAIGASLASKSFPESMATFDEALKAIPLMADVSRWGLEATRKGDVELQRLYTADMSLLLHLFRIAEDMGYEW